MLRAEHIVRLKLDRDRLLAHRQMPPPHYSTKELTSQIAAIGEAVIGRLLNVEPDVFQLQLEAARQFGVSLLTEDQQRNTLGVSAATSLIKSGDVIFKNMILPRDLMWKNPQLKAHYIIGVFLRGEVVNGVIPNVDEVEVAGWTDTYGIQKAKKTIPPPSFKSKLPVVMVPCNQLNPMEPLIRRLTANDACV